MLEEISQALSIKFNRSEDGQSFDMPTSPQKQGFPKKVKCFKCYGTLKENCLECQGSHMIKGSHPFAKLLNQVLLKKMNLSKIHSEEEDFENVYPIKQEEQDGQDKKLICFYCSVQCEFSCFSCQKCPLFSVCTQCYSKSIDHQHELEENFRFSNCQTIKAERKNCKHCAEKIEDCYTICRTCQAKDINYWICDSCSDSNIFKHPKNHVFEPVIQYDQNRHKRIQVLSQTFTEQDHQHSITYNDFLQPIELIDRPLNINCQAENVNLNGSLRLHRNISQSSSIQFDMESSLFNSHQIGTQFKSILRTKTKCSVEIQLSKKVKFSMFSCKSQQKQNNQAHFQQPIQHVFLDYKCDSCHSQRIVNVRYHCKSCQDYDLCQICYFSELFRHQHEHFDKIDGRVIKEKALKKIIGKEHDLNLISTRNSTCMSKSRRPPLESLLNTYL